MKNLKIGLLLFLGVLATSSTKAMGTVRINLVPGEQEKLMVDVLEAPGSLYQVELKDNKGDIVFYDTKESDSYDNKSVYNLSDLHNGKYTFEVKLGNENDMKDLVVNNKTVRIVNQEEQISPYFKRDGKYLEFSFPNLEDNNVRVLLYNNDSKHWIFQERISPEFDIQQALNLEKLRPGSYKAVLISGNGRYDYNFDLN